MDKHFTTQLLNSLRAFARRLVAKVREFGLQDRILLIALVIAAVTGIQGLTWGRYDCLNVDRMAFRTIFSGERPPFHPGSFLKPPLFTYMCHFTARIPATVVTGAAFWLEKKERGEWYFRIRLVLARLFNFTLFVASVALLYGVVRSYFGVTPARVAALIMATSAGFVAYKVFLTTENVLVFMMIASFVCAAAIVRNPGMKISIVAGLLVGLATAAKYNGLAVAIALPLAHLLASRGNPVVACLKRPAAWLCGLAVPVGFLIGNPYALFDWPKFRDDFIYNYTTTPVYGGVVEGTGYVRFFGSFPEIFGWPGTILLAMGIVAGLITLIGTGRKSDAWKLWLLALAVFALYTWKIGGFPRMQTRFVLPMAPFVLILAAAGFSLLFRARWLAGPALALILVYNLVCAWWMGELFRRDPRMVMLSHLEQGIDGPVTVELSKSIPKVKNMSSRDIQVRDMPGSLERSAKFDDIFANEEDMKQFRSRWKSREGPDWFSMEARVQRNPDWIIWASKDVERIVRPEYEALFAPESPYEVVFDASSPNRPAWAYPSQPEFVENRTTLWRRKTEPKS